MKLKTITDIPKKVREEVYERDSWDGCPCCVVCGKPRRVQMAHIVARSQGGKGIPENLVCLCVVHHTQLDNGNNPELQAQIKSQIVDYMRDKYPNWSEADLKARKEWA